MSKIYEHELQMEELAQDIEWQTRQEELERLSQLDMDNMEENKAHEFALRILEE